MVGMLEAKAISRVVKHERGFDLPASRQLEQAMNRTRSFITWMTVEHLQKNEDTWRNEWKSVPFGAVSVASREIKQSPTVDIWHSRQGLPPNESSRISRDERKHRAADTDILPCRKGKASLA